MADITPETLKILEELLEELRGIVEDIKKETRPSVPETEQVPDVKDIDLKKFFSSVRASLFSGRLTAGQVKGMEAKIKAFREASFPPAYAAYCLATSYHETARRMLPVREGLSLPDSWRKKSLRYYPYYGRGDVQLTWRANYEKADRELGLDGALLKNLDLALDPDVSAKILVLGMSEGWFTGKRLSDYLAGGGSRAGYKQARRIINGTDKAELIANQAILFEKGLKEAGY